MPVSTLSCSPMRCVMLPTPPEPKLSATDFVLPSSISDFMSFAGNDGCVNSTTGVRASSAIGAKSLMLSYGSLALQRRIGGVRADRDQQRVAIRRRGRDRLRADHVAGARPVLDDDRSAPNAPDMRCASSRPSVSTEPPGANGTMMRIGLSGYLSADCAKRGRSRAAAQAPQRASGFTDQLPPRSCTSGKNSPSTISAPP